MSSPLTVDDCTVDSCPVAGGFVLAPPHLAGNAFLLSAFALLVPFNIFFGVRHRTPLYSSLLIAGLLLETAGHLGKVLLRDDPASRSYFTLYMVGTVTGPTFITAAIFVVLPHILAVYGERFCVIPSPLWIGLVFFGFDVFTLTFQVVGCVFSVDGITQPEMVQGVYILLAGMGIQVFSLVLFFAVYYAFQFRLARHRELMEGKHSDVYLHPRFRIFLVCLQISAAFILARTITRIIQMCAGYGSVIFQSPTINMVLDSAVVLLACILLTMVPPGGVFGTRAWGETSPHKLPGRLGHGNRNSTAGSLYALQDSGFGQQPPGYYVSRRMRPRETKPYEHQVPGHLQYPNLYKPAPRPIVVAPYDHDAEIARLEQPDSAGSQMQPGSAGSQMQPGSAGSPRQPGSGGRQQARRMSPRYVDLVPADSLWR